MSRGADRGSATIWVVAAAALMLVVSGAGVLRTAAVLARHRAEAAADVAALAAAGRLGTGRPPCPAAAQVAARNGAHLTYCRVRTDPAGRAGVVDVAVALPIRLPAVGHWTVRATARAGRGAGAADGRPPRRAPDSPATGWRCPAVWHAGRGAREGVASSKREGDGEQEGERVEVSVSQNSAADVPVVAVSGEVDVYSAPELKERLSKLLESGATSVVVDLTDVAFLDSTGLGALVEARSATSDAGGELPIVCSQERILKLFTITGLDGVFSIHKSVDEALATLQA